MKIQKSSGAKQKESAQLLLSFHRPLRGNLGKRPNKTKDNNNNKSLRRKQVVQDVQNQQLKCLDKAEDPGQAIRIKDVMKRKTGLEAPSVIKIRNEKKAKKESEKQDRVSWKSKSRNDTQMSVREEENAQQRVQFEEINGKLVKIKADMSYHPDSYKCVAIDASQKRPTQNEYLRKSKR